MLTFFSIWSIIRFPERRDGAVVLERARTKVTGNQYVLPETDDQLIRRHIGVTNGRPEVVNTGYTVAIVVAHLVGCGWDISATEKALPDLTSDQIKAARAYAIKNWDNGVFSIARRRLGVQVVEKTFLAPPRTHGQIRK